MFEGEDAIRPTAVVPPANQFVDVEFFDVNLNEKTSFPEYESLKHKANVGLCFSGGGSRSFEATLGYLKGLLDADLLKHVRYISSVSGGSWANTVFSYHDESIVTLRELLCQWTPPEKLTKSKLNHISPKCARGYPVRSDLIANVLKELLIKQTEPSDIWVRAIHETFLKPAGIGIRDLPAWSRDDVSRTLARNPHLLNDIEFRPPCSAKINCDMPFPIINTAMLGPIEAAPFGLFTRRYVMMECTPMYTGFPKVQNVTYPTTRKVQLSLGGLIENLGFGAPITDEHFCGSLQCPEPV
jgi:Patatin-like phospholipase